jgi:hypothetical protein
MVLKIIYNKKMLLISLFLFFGIHHLALGTPSPKNIKPKTIHKLLVKDIGRKSFTYNVKIQDDDYSLSIVTTYLNDSLSPYEAGYTYPVTRQILIFRYKNTILKKFNHPVVNCKRELKNGKKAVTLENEIIQIGVLQGNNGNIYYVEGGSCNACSEFDGFYSLRGETLWYNYTHYKLSNDQWIRSVNKYNAMIKKYGIENRNIEMVSVLPIEKRNIKFKSRIIQPVIK